MGNNTNTFRNSDVSKTLFAISIGILIFWFVNHKVDFYHYALLGAIFELLWLFMLVKLVILPVMSFVYLIREKFTFRSLNLYTFIIAVTNICLTIFVLK